MNLCTREDYERVEQHFLEIGLPTRASFIDPALSIGVDGLMDIMSHDKKASSGKLKFIVAHGIGEASVMGDVPENLVRDVLRDSLGQETAGNKGRWKSAFSFHS
jgi:3-dehydroquinate synthase